VAAPNADSLADPPQVATGYTTRLVHTCGNALANTLDVADAVLPVHSTGLANTPATIYAARLGDSPSPVEKGLFRL
jgi:hypothetical protein